MKDVSLRQIIQNTRKLRERPMLIVTNGKGLAAISSHTGALYIHKLQLFFLSFRVLNVDMRI